MANEQNLRPFTKGYDPRRGSKPKGARHVSSYIQEMLENEQFKLSSGLKLKKMPMKAIVAVLIEKAVGGDLRAIDVLFKHGYGSKIELDMQDRHVPEITSEQAEQLLRLRAKRDIEP